MMPPWLDAIDGSLGNAAAILVGACLGARRQRDLPQTTQQSLQRFVAGAAAWFAFRLLWKGFGGDWLDVLRQSGCVAASLILSGLVCRAFKLQSHLSRLGQVAAQRFSTATRDLQQGKRPNIRDGWISATLPMLIGPLGVPGVFLEGFTGSAEILWIKSALDFLGAWTFGTFFGWRIALVATPVLLLQGSLALFVRLISETWWTTTRLELLTLTSGFYLMTLPLLLLQLRKFPYAHLWPALIFAPALIGWLGAKTMP